MTSLRVQAARDVAADKHAYAARDQYDEHVDDNLCCSPNGSSGRVLHAKLCNYGQALLGLALEAGCSIARCCGVLVGPDGFCACDAGEWD